MFILIFFFSLLREIELETLKSQINELNSLIKLDNRITSLETIEKKMENDDSVILLARKKEEREIAYSDLLKIYKDDSEEVSSARKNLFLAKKELESHPIVREYLSKYSEVRELYQSIYHIIFSSYSYNGNKVCE